MWCPARVPSVVGKTFIHVQKFLLFAEEKCLEKSHDSKDSKKRVSNDDWSLLTRNRVSENVLLSMNIGRRLDSHFIHCRHPDFEWKWRNKMR